MSSETYGGFAIVYDDIMEPIDYDGWFSFVMEAAARSGARPKSLVDVACGTGSVSVRAAAEGMSVTGVDKSENMLAQASQKATSMGLEIRFFQQDMRGLTVANPHDMAICLFDSLNYMIGREDLAAVFCSVSKALTEDGIFVFDLVTRKKALMVSDRPEVGETDSCFFVFDCRFSPRTDILSIDADFFVAQGSHSGPGQGSYVRYHEVHDKKVYDSETVGEILIESGFKGWAVCSGFAFKKGSQRSERHLFVCSKRLDTRELSSRLFCSSGAAVAAGKEKTIKYPAFDPGA